MPNQKKKNPQKQKKIIINPQIPECNTDEEADQLGTSCCCQSGRLPWSHSKKKNPCISIPPNDKTPQLPCQWVKDFGRFAVTSCLISFHTTPIRTVCIMLGMVVFIHFLGGGGIVYLDFIWNGVQFSSLLSCIQWSQTTSFDVLWVCWCQLNSVVCTTQNWFDYQYDLIPKDDPLANLAATCFFFVQRMHIWKHNHTS